MVSGRSGDGEGCDRSEAEERFLRGPPLFNLAQGVMPRASRRRDGLSPWVSLAAECRPAREIVAWLGLFYQYVGQLCGLSIVVRDSVA